MKLIAKLVLTAVALSSLNAFAQRKLTIQSTHDLYDVVIKSKTSGTVDGKPTNLAALADLWPVVDNPVAKIFMVAIALFVVGRAFMFTRSLRRDATQKV